MAEPQDRATRPDFQWQRQEAQKHHSVATGIQVNIASFDWSVASCCSDSCCCTTTVKLSLRLKTLSLKVQIETFSMAHLGGMDRGVGRAAGTPLRAEPAKLRGGMGSPVGNPFGAILAEVGGEDCTLELSDSSLCSVLTFTLDACVMKIKGPRGRGRKREGWGERCHARAVCHVTQAVGYHTAWHTAQ